MTSTSYPTVADIEQAKKDMTDINKFMALSAESFNYNTGKTRLTLEGLIAAVMEATGYVVAGTFSAGCTVTAYNQIVSDGVSYWRWGGALDKVVTAGSSPTPSGINGWNVVSDGAFKDSLAASGTTDLIAGFQAKQLKNIDGIKNLIAVAGVTMSVKGFYAGTKLGGGDFYYDATVSKTLHNGGTIIAPEAITAWVGTTATLGTLLNWTGTGSGCYVRTNVETDVNPSIFGAVENDRNFDNTDSLKKMHSVCKSTKYTASSEYTVKQTNQIRYLDGDKIDFNGASIYIHPTTTVTDTAGSFGRFSNWVYYRNETTAITKGITINKPFFLCEKVAVNGFGAADTRAVRNSHTATITLNNPKFIGAGEPTGLGGPTTGNDAKQGALWYGNGYNLTVLNPEIEWAGQGIIAQGCKTFIATGGFIRYSGLSKDFTTWANAAAILSRSSEIQIIDNVEITLTGGSSVFCSQDTEYAIKTVRVTNCNITGSGLLSISAGHRNYAATPCAADDITIKGNTIKGWCCAIGATLHTAVKVALESTDSTGYIRNVDLDNDIDFLAPWESFNTTTGDVTGSYNVNKTKNNDVGNQYGVQVSTTSTSYVDSLILKGICKNHSRLGGLVSGVKYVEINHSFVNNGWAKKSDDTAWQIQQSLRLSSNGTIVGSVEVINQSYGVVKNDSFCSPLFLSDNLDVNLDVKTMKLNNQKFSIRVAQAVSGCKTLINSLVTDDNVLDAGHRYSVDVSSGAFTQSSQLKVNRDSVNIITGGRVISPCASVVKKSLSDFSGNRIVTLYSAKLYTDKTIRFVGGITGDLTVTQFSGELIDGSASSLVIAPNVTVNLYSDGTAWYKV